MRKELMGRRECLVPLEQECELTMGSGWWQHG